MTKLAALTVFVLALLAVAFVADHDAWTPDEPRVAALGGSVAHGSWVAPRLGDTPFLEQPPFHAWSVAGAYRAFGETVAVARSVSVAWSVLSLILTYLLAEHLAGKRAGLLAALVLGTSVAFVWAEHRITADPALACFVTGSAYASLRGLTGTTRKERWLGLFFAYAGASLAYLSKGVVGVGLAGFAFVAVIAAAREPRMLLRGHLWLAPLSFAAITACYHWRLLEDCGPEGVRTVAWENTVNRASTGMAHAHYGPEYYFWNFPVSFLPSTLFFVGALVWFVRERKRLDAKGRFAWEMPLIWFALGFAGLSSVRSKREVYLLPILPGAAVVSALWLERVLDRQDESVLARYLPQLLGVVVMVAGIALPVVAGGFLGVGWLVPLGGALLAIAAGVAAQALAATERPGAALAAILAGGLALFGAADLSIVPFFDARKGLGRPLAEAVALVPSNRAVYALLPDETALGAVPFYTGRPVEPLPPRAAVGTYDDARRELVARLHGEREMWVLAIDKNEQLSAYRSVESLKPEVVYVWPAGDVKLKAREVRLLRFRAR